MTYSDTLFFIGKCLTLGRYPEKIKEVREVMRSGSVDWERIVWVSTRQFVFPALYLQLNRAGLIPELPAELAEYMEDFTFMNRERNREILNQAIEVTTILNQYDIEPIFLKGTAHLLDGLYEDIGERMMVDIDLLVDEKDILQAWHVLHQAGYYSPKNTDPACLHSQLHYPILIMNGKPASVEIHRWAVIKPYNKVFSFDLIDQNRKKIRIPKKLMYFQMIIKSFTT